MAYERVRIPNKGVNRARTRGTLEHFAVTRWNDINKRTVNGSGAGYTGRRVLGYLARGIRLNMTKKEFYDWVWRQSAAISALYAEGKTPSIDRIDPLGHYEESNIRIISWEDNRKGKRSPYLRHRKRTEK